MTLNLALMGAIVLALGVAHAEISPLPATLRARQTTERHTVIEYCELSHCRPLGRALGYQMQEWNEIQRICSTNALYAPVTDILLPTVILGISSLFGKPGLILGVAAIATLRPGEPRQNYWNGGQMLPGALSGNTFRLSLDPFISLRDGIQACAEEFNRWERARNFISYCNPVIRRTRCDGDYQPSF